MAQDEQTITLANGAIYDKSKHRIVANPGGGKKAISQANASALSRKRWDKFRHAAAKGATRAAMAIDPSVVTVYDAHAVLTERAVVEFLDKPSPAMYEEISKGIGARPLPGELQAQQAQAQASGLHVADADAVLLVLMRVHTDSIDDECIDGQAHDVADDMVDVQTSEQEGGRE